jgi:hypothetical protein
VTILQNDKAKFQAALTKESPHTWKIRVYYQQCKKDDTL